MTKTEDLRREYHRHREGETDTLVAAFAMIYEQITGKQVSDRLREQLYQAVRFDG